MVTKILMPRLSLTMEWGTVSYWHKKEGDPVKKGEPIVEVNTEKVMYDIEAPSNGILRKILALEGDEVSVAGVLGIITASDEVLPETVTPKQILDISEKRVLASPAAKRLAREHGIDLTKVEITVKERITKKDVEKIISETKATTQIKEIIPLSGIRKVAAENVYSSYSKVPHCTITMEVDMSNIISTNKKSNYSYTALITKTVTSALTKYPIMNSTLKGKQIKIFDSVNIGIAVTTEKGLVVPVIHKANKISIRELSSTLRNLVQRAREGRLSQEEMSGGTFTITNLGMFGVETFTPIINPPEAAILGIGRINEKPVVLNGEIKIKPITQLSLSFDHRIVDGAPAAQFLQKIKELIEKYTEAT